MVQLKKIIPLFNKNSILKSSFILFFLILIFLLNDHSVYAHKMVVEKGEQGTLQVRYDEGTSAQLAQVSAYDEGGNLLFKGAVDHQGIFHYDKNISVFRFVADDGLGHRATLINEKENSQTTIPVWLRTILGVSILAIISLLVHLKILFKTNEVKSLK